MSLVSLFRTKLIYTPGSLRNIVGASSDKTLQDDLKTLTNETILPLVNGLLDVDLSFLVQQVMQHVTAMVSSSMRTLHVKLTIE